MLSSLRYVLYVLLFLAVSTISHIFVLGVVGSVFTQIIVDWLPIPMPYGGMGGALHWYGIVTHNWHWYVLSTVPVGLLFLWQGCFLWFQLRHQFDAKRWLAHCVGAWALAVIVVILTVEADELYTYPPSAIIFATGSNVIALIVAYYLQKYHEVSLVAALLVTLPLSSLIWRFLLPEVTWYTHSFFFWQPWEGTPFLVFAMSTGFLFGLAVLLTYPVREARLPIQKAKREATSDQRHADASLR